MPIIDVNNFRTQFQLLSIPEQEVLLSNLSSKELRFIYDNPKILLFDKQIIEGDFRYCVLMSGRGFGKSFAGSAWLAQKVIEGAKSLAFCAPTHEECVKNQLPVFLSWFSDDDKPSYNSQTHILTFTKGKYKGTKVYCYTSEKEIRGANLEKLWCDEIVIWADSIPEKIEERFNTLDLCVRSGSNPQTVITSTPKPIPILYKWKEEFDKKNPAYKVMTGTTFDNPYLPKSFLDAQIDKHGNSRYGRQELYGELLEQVEGALWTHSLIDRTRIAPNLFNLSEMERIVIGVDPAITDGKNSDLTGIIVAAISKGHAYVLSDNSIKCIPEQWARVVNDLYTKYKANLIVAEGNQGQLLVSQTLRSIDKNLPVKLVNAKHNKITRAEPVSALYENSKVHHIGYFQELEKEMCLYTGDPKQKSPDHMDAMVYAITELLLLPKYTNRDISNIGKY